MRTLIALAALLAASPAHADDYWGTYGAHYAGLATGLLTAGTAAAFDPPDPPRLGPAYAPDGPPAGAPLDLSMPFAIDQRISESELAVGLATGLSVATLLGVSDDDPRWHAHDAALGYLGALTTTVALTEVAKVTVGRLRPDYARRMAWCRDHPDRRACKSGHLAKDGRKSFFSGHSSTAFAAATFLTWQLGGRFLWRDGAHWGARAGAGLGAASMLAGATWVVWSRVADGRHHLSDVLTGGAVGAGVATLWYLSLFDLQGDRRLAGSQPGRATQALMVGTSGVF